jgi:hypothetical protein
MSAIMNQGKSALNGYICPANVLHGGAPNLVPIVLYALHTAHLQSYISRPSPHSPIKSALPPPYPFNIALHRSRATAFFFSIHHYYTSWVHRSHPLPAHVVHSCTLSLPPDRGARCATASHARFGLAIFVRRVHVVRFCHTAPTTAPVWLRLIG